MTKIILWYTHFVAKTKKTLNSLAKSFKFIRAGKKPGKKSLKFSGFAAKLRNAYVVNQKRVTIGLVVILLLTLAYIFKGAYIVASVNNQPISRLSVIKRLERAQGEEALDGLITETLIKQEAKKAKVVVSQEEIDAQIAEIEANLSSQGQTLEARLASEGMTREDLSRQIEIQKKLEALLSSKVEVSESDVLAYIDENKDYLPTDMEEGELKESARQQLLSEKMASAFQSWIQEVKGNSDINYFVSY